MYRNTVRGPHSIHLILVYWRGLWLPPLKGVLLVSFVLLSHFYVTKSRSLITWSSQCLVSNLSIDEYFSILWYWHDLCIRLFDEEIANGVLMTMTTFFVSNYQFQIQVNWLWLYQQLYQQQNSRSNEFENNAPYVNVIDHRIRDNLFIVR